MSPRTRFNFFIDAAQRDGLRAIEQARGVGMSEQIRRAIDDWLKREGIKKATSRRGSTRRKV